MINASTLYVTKAMLWGKSGVNIPRLVRNIADQYSFAPEHAAIIELVANALDAGASRIDINLRPEEGTLEVTDNGHGMGEKEFREFHDFASSTKTRGSGIGFAGLGAKLALNFCSKIVTETRSSSFWGTTEWRLEGDEAPYYSIDQKSLKHEGTTVKLYLDKKSRNYYNVDLIRQILYEHYFPLVDDELRTAYRKDVYKNNLTIFVNGKEVVEDSFLKNCVGSPHKFYITVYRKPKAYGIFVLLEEEKSNVLEGVAVCCWGKVIERTFFKKEPRDKKRIVGWIEAPYLIKAVTTDKCRFQKGNKLWEGFFRKAQKEFADWLDKVGLIERVGQKERGQMELEHELNKIIKQLPELTYFSSHIRQPVVEGGDEQILRREAQPPSNTAMEGQRAATTAPRDESDKAHYRLLGGDYKTNERTRTIKGGIRLAFEDRMDIPKESWFDGETVTINKVHAAYLRAEREKLLNYHILKCAAMSILEFNMEREPEPSYKKIFETSEKFFRLWGQT